MNLEKEIFDIELTDIMPNRFQPREIFDDEALQELANSIREHGVIQPIIVRKVGDKYELIAGERRYRASQLAGKQTIPALVRDIDDKETAKIALLENLQRKDLTPIEEAKTYQTILKLDNITQDELAQSLGKSQSSIANKLRLLNLDEEVQTALLNSQISERHARSLLPLDNNTQRILLNKILNERLTVRQLDEEVMKITGKMPESEEQDQNSGEFFNHNMEQPEISTIPNDGNNNINENNQGVNNLNNNMNTIVETPINQNSIEQVNMASPQTEINPYINPVGDPYTVNNEQQNISPQGQNLEPINTQVTTDNITNIPVNQPNTNLENNPVGGENNNYNEVQVENNEQSTTEIPATEGTYKENIFDKLRVKSEQLDTTTNNENIILEPNTINSNEQTTIINSEVNNEPNNEPNIYNNIYDLRFAINNFRQAIQNTEKFGFKVKTEEIDEPNSYKIIIEIDK